MPARVSFKEFELKSVSDTPTARRERYNIPLLCTLAENSRKIVGPINCAREKFRDPRKRVQPGLRGKKRNKSKQEGKKVSVPLRIKFTIAFRNRIQVGTPRDLLQFAKEKEKETKDKEKEQKERSGEPERHPRPSK